MSSNVCSCVRAGVYVFCLNRICRHQSIQMFIVYVSWQNYTLESFSTCHKLYHCIIVFIHTFQLWLYLLDWLRCDVCMCVTPVGYIVDCILDSTDISIAGRRYTLTDPCSRTYHCLQTTLNWKNMVWPSCQNFVKLGQIFIYICQVRTAEQNPRRHMDLP